MSAFVDLAGQKIGRLSVVSPQGTNKYKNFIWLCKCECGNFCSVASKELRRKKPTQSCGCLRRENTQKALTTHNMAHSRIYSIWNMMLSRCKNKNNFAYKNYGGRGIVVCEEWHTFARFYEWAMANGYDESLSIDRIDNDKGYCPENCRWVTHFVQANNTRRNIYLTYNGKTHTIAEWSRLVNIKYATLMKRYHSGWSAENILFKAVRRK